MTSRPRGGWPDEDAALRTIRDALSDATAPYVACSGGKDSMVVAHLTGRIDPSVPVVHSTHGARWLPDHWPGVLLEALEVMGHTDVYWTDQNLIRARDGGGFDSVLLGLRRAESRRRAQRMDSTPRLNPQVEECWPIAGWNDEQVWAYTASHDLPYLSLYDEGYRRTHWPETDLDQGPWSRVHYRVSSGGLTNLRGVRQDQPMHTTATAAYRKTRDGEWVAFGPLALFKQAITTPEGPDTITVDTITVTKKSGEAKVERVVRLGKPFKVDGVDHVYAYLAKTPRRTGARRTSRYHNTTNAEDFGHYSDTGY